MSDLRPLVLVLTLLLLGAGPAWAQRDPERPPPQILQPAPVAPPAPAKTEGPAPALPAVVAVCCALLVLFIVCNPSRKGTPT